MSYTAYTADLDVARHAETYKLLAEYDRNREQIDTRYIADLLSGAVNVATDITSFLAPPGGQICIRSKRLKGMLVIPAQHPQRDEIAAALNLHQVASPRGSSGW